MADETKPLSEMTKAELVDFAEEKGLAIDKSRKVEDLRGDIHDALQQAESQPSQAVAPIEARRPDEGPIVEPPAPPEAAAAPATIPDDHYSLDQIIQNSELLLGEPGFLVEAAINASAGDTTHLTLDQVRALVDDFKALETEVA
jgi:hypothetical protein